MKAFILNIGDEVLSGKTINTNSSFIAMELSKLSISVDKVVVVGDDEVLIKKEVEWFKNSDFDILISTGGLGPTHDDLSKEAICAALELDLVLDEKSKAKIDNYFNNNAPSSNLKQAYFPKEAIIIDNLLGTANGAIIPFENKHYIILVGPPYELEPMVKIDTLNYLRSIQIAATLYKEYIVMGGGESFFEDLLLDLINNLNHVGLTPYASIGKIRYVIKANEKYKEEYLYVTSKFEKLMDKYIISTNNEEIEEVLFKLLKENNYKISFAESITGGMMASTFINVSGASNYLKESFITYSNEAKMKYLNVSSSTLKKYTEVSIETVKEMVEGLQARTKTEVAFAVTGYAGPAGDDVGLVYFGIKIKDQLYLYENKYRGSREMIRMRATLGGLYKIVSLLKTKNDIKSIQ